MLGSYLVWGLLLATSVTLLYGLANPKMRPYAKQLVWAAVGVAISILGFYLLGRRPGRSVHEPDPRDAEKKQLNVLDRLLEKSEEKQLEADAELLRHTELADVEKEEFQEQLTNIQKQDDSLLRRKALIQLMKDYSK